MPQHPRKFGDPDIRRTQLFHAGLARPLLFGLVAASLFVTAPAIRAQTLSPQVLSPVPAPADPTQVTPIERVPRSQFGVVGSFPLSESDLSNLFFPSATEDERQAALVGLDFFTTPHTVAEGAGPIANQTFCLGCHRNSLESVKEHGRDQLVTTASQVSRAARTTPTNFGFVGFDPTTGGGRPADILDPLENTGKTESFTVFADFNPGTGVLDPISKFSSNSTQHTRNLTQTDQSPGCVPDPLPLFADDPNLAAGVDPVTHLGPTGFRRAIGERAAPPYIGRGLIEAVPDAQILADEAEEKMPIKTSIDAYSIYPDCTANDCLAGRHNENPSNNGILGGDPTVRVGHFGLRAAGPVMLQFVDGGIQGEDGFTYPLNPNEQTSFYNGVTPNPDPAHIRPGCLPPKGLASNELTNAVPISLRNLIRLTAPPEYGAPLLAVLNASDPTAPRLRKTERMVQRGAELFGVDLQAFANRVIAGRMPAGGDGLDDHAINQADRMLNCVGCHYPVTMTGQLPTDVASTHVNNKWAPLFSDLLLHKVPSIDAERDAPTARLPLLIWRHDGEELVPSLDIPRSLADDALPKTQNGLAMGNEFRTSPLMGIGRIGPPFMHDARVYLSKLSVGSYPASTVYSDATVTNAPLVIKTVDDALRAAIEVHDLPPPDTSKQCPVPPGNMIGAATYANGAADVCPPYSSPNRSDDKTSIARYRSLSAEDQLAVIEFMKQL